MSEKKIVMTIRIFPEGDQISLDEILLAIRTAFPEERISNARTDPIAYGIEALIVDITAPETEGISQVYEDKIKSIKGVGQITIESERRFIDVSRPK